MTLPIEKEQIAKTTAQWTALNPVLALDVIGIEVMTNGYNRYKRGDGATAWSSLAYLDKVYSNQAVTSVNNKTGAVTLTKSDVGLGSVDNTADSNKSVYNSARLGGSLPSAFAPASASPVSGWGYGANVSAYTADVATTFYKMGNFVYISALLNFTSARPAYTSLFILPSTLQPNTLRVGSIQSYKGTDSYSCIVAGAYIYSDATIPAGQWALSFGYFI